MTRARIAFLIGAVLLTAPGPAAADAGDWPCWRGADRTAVSAETGLLKEWPDGGPKKVWKATGLGGGHSSVAVANGKVYTLGSRGGDEHLLCLDAKDGKELWAAKVGRVGRSSPGASTGPRSTPAVDGDFVFALGSDGDLVCVENTKGELKWKKSLRSDFGGSAPKWAFSESPLVDGDLLVCSPGSADATMVALHKKDGSLVWKAAVPGNHAAYASAIVAEVGGVRQYVQFLSGGVVGVSAKDGKFLWQYDKSAVKGRSPGTNCATPVFHDGYVFTASGYGTGGGMVKLTADQDKVAAKEVYFSRELENHHGGLVRVGDYLYGTNNTALLCVDFKTGEKKWSERSVGKGSLAAADGMLYVRGERGGVALVEATPAGYKERGRFTPERGAGRDPAWPHPVLANGKLYLRDGDTLLCYDVKAK